MIIIIVIVVVTVITIISRFGSENQTRCGLSNGFDPCLCFFQGVLPVLVDVEADVLEEIIRS